MRARRLLAIVSAWAVAIVLVLTLPVAQLAVAAPSAPSCCCPHPELCHCPDHQPGGSPGERLRPCRPAAPAVAELQLPAFTPPAPVAIAVPVAALAPVTFVIPPPHAPPLPDERAAPS